MTLVWLPFWVSVEDGGGGEGRGRVHGRVSSGQQGFIKLSAPDPNGLGTLSLCHAASPSAHCIALFALYIFPARTHVYVFTALLRVCVRSPLSPPPATMALPPTRSFFSFWSLSLASASRSHGSGAG